MKNKFKDVFPKTDKAIMSIQKSLDKIAKERSHNVVKIGGDNYRLSDDGNLVYYAGGWQVVHKHIENGREYLYIIYRDKIRWFDH